MRLAASIQSLDHIQIAMPRGKEDQARAFYRDLLGLVEVKKPTALAGRGGVWLEGPDLKLHLGVDPDFTPAKKAHPAFVVDRLAAFRSRLAAAGHTIIDGEVLEGFHRFHTHDPFGNRIELMARAEET